MKKLQAFLTVKKITVINQWTVIVLVVLVLLAVAKISDRFQEAAEKNAFIKPFNNSKDSNWVREGKGEMEIYKLAAEVRQIRSDTGGSLFWLKLVALFVTVGGAVGGYLIAQSAITKNKLNYELRKNIDETYQKVIVELSADAPILRAASAVKLGGIIQNFPKEWVSSENRRDAEKRKDELIQLTKQVLAAALAIEKNEKVLKSITIALARKPGDLQKDQRVDLRQLDLSLVCAKDAYWANVDFTYADFFRATLSKTSFSKTDLTGTSFYYANLSEAVLKGAVCHGTNFSYADLRKTDFTGAKLNEQTNFTGAKVFGIGLDIQQAGQVKDTLVDVSASGDGSAMEKLLGWLEIKDNAED